MLNNGNNANEEEEGYCVDIEIRLGQVRLVIQMGDHLGILGCGCCETDFKLG